MRDRTFGVALGVLLIALAARKLLPDAPFVVIAAAVTAAAIVAIALQEHSAGRIAFVRYVSPMSQGLAAFFVIELIRGADALPRRDPARVADWVAPVLAVTAAICVAAVGYSGLATSLEYPTVPGGASLVDRAIRNELRPTKGFLVPTAFTTTPALRRAYRRALAGVDPDRTIAAVDRPYLIDYRRFDIPNMDLPGFTAPGGNFPFFTGPGAKVATLRRAGYDTLLATVPGQRRAQPVRPPPNRLARRGLKAYLLPLSLQPRLGRGHRGDRVEGSSRRPAIRTAARDRSSAGPARALEGLTGPPERSV